MSQANGNHHQDPRTHAIIGAAMEVHRELGRGFTEPVYQAALAVEFARQALPFQAQSEAPVYYRGDRLPVHYVLDFVCFKDIVVEIKALPRLSSVEESQLLNYLKATGHEVGLLINFGASSLGWKRMIHSRLVTTDSRSSEEDTEHHGDE